MEVSPAGQSFRSARRFRRLGRDDYNGIATGTSLFSCRPGGTRFAGGAGESRRAG